MIVYNKIKLALLFNIDSTFNIHHDYQIVSLFHILQQYIFIIIIVFDLYYLIRLILKIKN